MSSQNEENENPSRREFFQGVTSGAAGAAFVGALASLGVPVISAAQDGKVPEPKKAESKFF